MLETVMTTVQVWFDWLWQYVRMGFQDINAQVLGLVVAMVAAYFLSKWSRVFVIAIGAVVGYIVADMMIGVLAGTKQFRLPDYLVNDWRVLVGLYAGFLFVITIFYIVKKFMLKGGH